MTSIPENDCYPESVNGRIRRTAYDVAQQMMGVGPYGPAPNPMPDELRQRHQQRGADSSAYDSLVRGMAFRLKDLT